VEEWRVANDHGVAVARAYDDVEVPPWRAPEEFDDARGVAAALVVRRG
jgi:hypothetical protein